MQITHKKIIMIRNILSIVFGIVSSFIVILLIETIGHYISPPPVNFDLNKQDELKTYIESAPAIVFIMVLIAYAVGSFIGGLVAALIATDNKNGKALTVGGILLGLGVINLIMIPHPIWMIILGLAVFIPFAYIGGKIGIKLTTKKI